MNEQNKAVTAKMLAAVETGGQVYGRGRWDDYTAPKTNSSLEYTCTLGAYAFYGEEARMLIRMIFEEDTELFRSLDDGRIEEMLPVDWVSIHWWPSAGEAGIMQKLIRTEVGIRCQERLLCELRLPKYIARAEEYGVLTDEAQMMWCEIQHLGGLAPTQRVFARCGGDYSMDSILASLKQDQEDARYSSNGVGSKKYWSRHEACVRMIKEHAEPHEDGIYIKIGG